MTGAWAALAGYPASGMLALKRYMPKTLFGRAMAIIMTPLILMQGISVFVFFDRHWDNMAYRLAQSLAGDAAWIADELTPLPPPAERQDLSRRARRLLQMEVNYEPAATLAGPEQVWSRGQVEHVLDQALRERVGLPFRIDPTSEERRLIMRLQLSGGVLELVVSKKRLYTSTHYIFLMWMFGSSLVLFAIAIIFMRNQIRPIRRLAAAAHAFGKGRTVGAFRMEGATEVRQAAEAFQLMRERIGRQLTQRTEMLAGVSHDLRTPLTSMKLALAMLPEDPETDGLKRDVRHMEQMVEGFLAFSRGEGGERPQITDMAGLVDSLVEDGRRNGGNVSATRTVTGSAMLEVRADAVRRAITNLLDNAMRYAGRVHVSLDMSESAVTITVDDDGPGVPEQQREAVFKPFFRLDASRNPETGGAGLGLSIARDVARSHGGDVVLEDAPGGGLRAIRRLPV